MNKKLLLILSVLTIIVGFIVVFFFTKKNSDSETSTTQTPVTNFNNQGNGVRYNESESAIESYDAQSGEYRKIASVDSQPTYSEISPDQKYLLYTTEASGSSGDEGDLFVIELATDEELIFKQGVCSPRFMPDGKVIYQVVEDDSSFFGINDTAGESKEIASPISDQAVIEPINSDYVIAYEFSYDVGKSTAYLVNITDNTSSELASGEGLKVKTVLNSQYAAVQTISSEKSSVEILAWKSKRAARNIDNIALDDIDWQQDTYYVYAKSGAIYKSSFESTADAEVAKAPNPIVQLKLISPSKLFITSTEKSYTTTF